MAKLKNGLFPWKEKEMYKNLIYRFAILCIWRAICPDRWIVFKAASGSAWFDTASLKWAP